MKNIYPDKAREIQRAIINTNGQKRLPPYGKTLQDQLAHGITPKNDILILTGLHAWRFAKQSQDRPKLLLPVCENPLEFYWPVHGYDCLVFKIGDLQECVLLQLAEALLRDGAANVRVIAGDEIAVFRGSTHVCGVTHYA